MTQVKRPLGIILLTALYSLFTIIALWRATQYATFDILTLGVLPVLVGLLIRAKWAKIVLFFHLGLQTLVLIAMGATALIAYQITPEDVKIEFNGQIIPIWIVASAAISLVTLQWWAALNHKARQYLNNIGI
ncbi:hypothetical protein [Shewanella glacialimarina]|jgi:hypothetical protein|uniref:hypothetical protein n=1 Tax=Shewanella glacialimarina TaxID=2590884 RepID=UPI001CF8FC23|nr:hypothetical protein [Shewanella glacialimarina]UCX03483.1 hypothetical protein FJ709_02475 [Shewanella glacialimarina]